MPRHAPHAVDDDWRRREEAAVARELNAEAANVGDALEFTEAGAAVLRRQERAVQRVYDHWFDAGLGPHQVDVRVRPDGLVETRLSAGDLYRPPIDLDALTSWELRERDPAASLAVGDLAHQAAAFTRPCIDAFFRRLRAEGRRLTQDIDWNYVWRVRSEDGRGRVVEVEVREEWWPVLFDQRDRACHRAAFVEIEKLETLTDAHDFDYRIETGIFIPAEGERP